MHTIFSFTRAWYYFFPEPVGELPLKYRAKNAFSAAVDRGMAIFHEKGWVVKSK